MSLERRHGGLPLAVYVIALLLVPMTAVGFFGSREISRNDQVVASTTRLADLVDLRAAAASLRAPLQVERLAALGLSRLAELGVVSDPVLAATGLDLTEILDVNAAGFRESRRDVIAALDADPMVTAAWRSSFDDANAELDDVMSRLADDAAPPTLDEIEEVFGRVDASIDLLESIAISETELVVAPSADEAEMVSNVAAVADVATSAASEIESVADAAFLPSEPEMMEMMGSSLRHADALLAVEPVDPVQVSELTAQYEALPYFGADFFAFTNGDSMDLATVSAMGQALALRVDYLNAVADFAADESAVAVSFIEGRSAAAEQDNRNTIVGFAVVGVLTLLFGVVVIRSFARPLTNLRLQAERIGRGELAAEQISLGGPSDIRKVTTALNDMSSTLASVDEHMQALALSDLDTEQELAALPGKVGASMRNSMERVTALTSRLRASEARLAEEARIDNLTGLPNRFAVLEHLDRLVGALSGADGIAWAPPVLSADDDLAGDEQGGGAPASSASVGVMFLDVDGFKSVNDTHGHAVGDVVLREIAQRLRGSVRDIDYVARLGGDEFLIIVRGTIDTAALASFGERLIGEIEQPYVIGDQLFAVSASVGVTSIEPGDDALSAIERADAAVYQAKRRGRRRVEMFDQELQASIEHQAELELALRQAIQHDELRVHLQPLADLSTGRSIGAEALVRWERPGVGLLPPGEFIPIAERSGLIFDLERWVLGAACKRIAEWRMRGLGDGMRLAVNISGRHLIEGDLLAALDSAIAATGADPNLLEIELTESHLLDDVNRAVAVLAGLRQRGVKVAIDDFGTGYSSMTYLQKLPVDIIKIDRSFVNSATSNEFDSTVIESVVTISRALSLEIVAEGIETTEQLDYVTRAGCHYGQGFFLARPLPVAEAEAIMFGAPMFQVGAFAPPQGEPLALEIDARR